MGLSTDIDILISNSIKCLDEEQYSEAHNIVLSILNDKDLKEKLNTNQWQEIADIELMCSNFDLAKSAYEKADNLPGIAFTLILLGNLIEAKNILLKSEPSPASNWGIFLVDLFAGAKIKKWPSLLLIRHFLEFTVYHLLLAKKYEYIEQLNKNLKRLLQTNLHSEKLIGLAYFHYGDLEKAIIHFNNSLQHDNYDGELYFFFGQLYLELNRLEDAITMLERAHSLTPDHSPTKELLEKIKKQFSL